ncbi:hypothetical protein [Thalassomonas haliotis]|uniref:Uncharacterized protein n=1 Tax=Thalassomonas haliotis TaxID=485448 RepID=A0ABY7VGP5_9GAMM|nr:hypothetical protein [Thalassomonas haliotis]WDE11847.1 hypothetical protein H3N35_27280 [Thalassomonas haliotis]
MNEITNEDWFFICIGIMFFITAIATFCFIRISGKHIEREMKREGKLPPGWDSTMGLRYGFYAIVLVRNSVAAMSFVDDESVLRYARKKDRFLAFFFVISSSILLVIGGLTYFLYAP